VLADPPAEPQHHIARPFDIVSEHDDAPMTEAALRPRPGAAGRYAASPRPAPGQAPLDQEPHPQRLRRAKADPSAAADAPPLTRRGGLAPPVHPEDLGRQPQPSDHGPSGVRFLRRWDRRQEAQCLDLVLRLASTLAREGDDGAARGGDIKRLLRSLAGIRAARRGKNLLGGRLHRAIGEDAPRQDFEEGFLP